ncbi:MAG TPA: formylglycine-generating enzyme family protein [Bacillota bacterium]|nr:formylglycine-generating enzyme family protein [Bacillota bacterium]
MKKSLQKLKNPSPRKTLKLTGKQYQKYNTILILIILVLVAAVTVTIFLIMPGLRNSKTIWLGAGVRMRFVLIHPGSFTMGSDPNLGDSDETPPHQVTLTHPFYLGQTEVTQAQWRQIMGSNPSTFKDPKLPVDSVSWNECQRFLKKLNEKTGRKFALPTEAQWEYACRAGTTTRWYFGDDEALAGDYAWCVVNSDGKTHPVGKKKPNPWGLYDMSGNLWEWCADWYADHYASTELGAGVSAGSGAGVSTGTGAGPAIDPKGPATGTSRVLRGGSWGDSPGGLRTAYRNCIGPDGGHNGTGLRIVMKP